MQKRGINIDSLALIFSFILFAQLLSYIVPQGTFDRVPYPDNPNRSMVVAGTYAEVSPEEEVTLPAWYFLEGVTKGLADAQDIIFLIFIVGGVIEILRKTGAIDAALHRWCHRNFAQDRGDRCRAASLSASSRSQPVDINPRVFRDVQPGVVYDRHG